MNFQQRKLELVMSIMGVGMFLALAWNVYQSAVLGKSYPHSTFLFNPYARFGDFSDTVFTANLSNPYDNPLILYLPFTWIVFHALFPTPTGWDLVGFLFINLSALVILLTKVLGPLVPHPWKRVLNAYFLLFTSYPILFTLDPRQYRNTPGPADRNRSLFHGQKPIWTGHALPTARHRFQDLSRRPLASISAPTKSGPDALRPGNRPAH